MGKHKPMRVVVYDRHATLEQLIAMNRNNPELVASLQALAEQKQEYEERAGLRNLDILPDSLRGEGFLCQERSGK
jgi:hypothetical protein